MKVLFLPEVREYLDEVSHIMYEKDYFSFLESSEKYMQELVNDVINTLPSRQKKLLHPILSDTEKNVLFLIQEK